MPLCKLKRYHYDIDHLQCLIKIDIQHIRNPKEDIL